MVGFFKNKENIILRIWIFKSKVKEKEVWVFNYKIRKSLKLLF